jgi:hypothetical protein
MFPTWVPLLCFLTKLFQSFVTTLQRLTPTKKAASHFSLRPDFLCRVGTFALLSVLTSQVSLSMKPPKKHLPFPVPSHPFSNLILRSKRRGVSRSFLFMARLFPSQGADPFGLFDRLHRLPFRNPDKPWTIFSSPSDPPCFHKGLRFS